MKNKKKIILSIVALIIIITLVTAGIFFYSSKEKEKPTCSGGEAYTVAKSDNIKNDYHFKTIANKNYAYSEELDIGIRTYEIKQTNELAVENKIERPAGWTSDDYNIAHSLYINAVYQYLELDKLEQQLEQTNELKQIDTCKLSDQIHGDVQKDVNKFLFNSKYIAIDTWFSVEKLSKDQQTQLFSTLSMSKQERNETLKKLVEDTMTTTISKIESHSTPRPYPKVEYRDGKDHPVGGVWKSDLMFSVYHEDANQSFVKGRSEYKESSKAVSRFENEFGAKKKQSAIILFQPVHY